jgi:uncharacterized protein involved in exopolysaccharide biosynthesis
VSLVESQIRVVLSEAVLRPVVEKLSLDKDPEFVGGNVVTDLLKAVLPLGPSEDPRIVALRALQKSVDALRASRSYVILVKARSEEPEKSARIADTIATVYMEHEARTHADTTRRLEAALASRLKELAEQARLSDEAVQTFRRQNNLVGPGGRLINDQQLEDLNGRLVAARTTTATQRARLDQVERLLRSGADPDAIAEAVQSTTITNLRTQYAEIMRQDGTASVLLGPRHPDAKAIQEQRARQRGLITDELRRIAASTRGDYLRAKASEDALATELDTLKRNATTTNEASVRLRELERVAQSSRTIYESFLVRAKELGEQGRVDASGTRVIAAALPPNRPTGTRGGIVLLALLAGLAAATALVWMRARNTLGGASS